MSEHTLYLVACSARKAAVELPAQLLYTGATFCWARRYMEVRQATWYILSAEHGVVDPMEMLSPYDRPLHSLSPQEMRVWGRRVLSQLRPLAGGYQRCIVFAGRRYRWPIENGLRDLFGVVETPMDGLGIGRQLAWLKNGTLNYKPPTAA